MQAVERSASQAQQQRLTPVPGGESIGGNGAIPIPTGVPEVIQKVIAGANEIADFPYVLRRRSRVVRRQRLRLLGLGQLRAGRRAGC